MRTKWQSSPAFGDSAEKVLKGNRSVGDDRVTFWEILLDLSRRVYPGSHHSVPLYFCSRLGISCVRWRTMPERGWSSRDLLPALERPAFYCRRVRGGELVPAMSELLRKSVRWAAFIGFVTALMAMVMTVVSTALLNGVSWSGGLLVVLVIVAINVVFDMLGTAAAAGTERPFHAMAAKKVPGARHAIAILRRADQFSNFCNDVIGDICGIISGAAAFAVVGSLVMDVGGDRTVWDVFLVSVISALTVGWKALGKTLSIHYANPIIFQVGKLFFFLEDKLHIRLFNAKNNRKRKRKRGVSRAPRKD